MTVVDELQAAIDMVDQMSIENTALRAENQRLLEQLASLQASSGYEASIAQVEIERLRDYSAGLEDVLRRSALEPKP